MKWTRSDTLPLASADCVNCHGLGLRHGRLNETEPCNCVLRSIFRACFQRYVDCSEKEKALTRVTLDGIGPQCRRFIWGRKDEEYLADFILITKRTLDEAEYRLFRFHFLLGADWRLCCRRLGIDKGAFYHVVYRIQRKLGRAFRETRPYSLYPIDEYFNGTTYDPELGDERREEVEAEQQVAMQTRILPFRRVKRQEPKQPAAGPVQKAA